jgi:septal ring factor EnvC (AmiA/AmiB activator)
MVDVVDPNATATSGIQALQDSIKKLNGMLTQDGADVSGITAQIRALVAEQTDLRFLALRTLEDSPENKKAIDDLNAASKALSDEAANIGAVATALNDAAKVMSAAASLVTALAPFLA